MLRVGASFSLRIFVSQKSTVVLYGVFVGFYHLLYHLTADGTSFLGGKIAVVTLLEVYADFVGSFHLELIHGLAGVGIHNTVGLRHFVYLLICLLGIAVIFLPTHCFIFC